MVTIFCFDVFRWMVYIIGLIGVGLILFISVSFIHNERLWGNTASTGWLLIL